MMKSGVDETDKMTDIIMLRLVHVFSTFAVL